MMWEGQGVARAKLGKMVVRDEWLFPRLATYTYTGDRDLPDLTAQFEYRVEGPVCLSLTVTAKPGGYPVTDATVRLFNLQALAELTYSRLGLLPDVDGDTHILRAIEKVQSEALDVIQSTNKDALLVQVARVYLTARSGSNAPTDAVAQSLGGSRSTAARRVRAARQAGLIPPLGAGDDAYDTALSALVDRPVPSAKRTREETIAILDKARAGGFPSGDPDTPPTGDVNS